MTITKKAFFAAYDEAIVGRTFVENASYYRMSGQRFWQCFHRIDLLDLPRGATALDIGGGIMAVLLKQLLGFDAAVGDVNDKGREDVTALGLKFDIVDLFSDERQDLSRYDLIVLQEVIEHIPQPPYLVLNRIKHLMNENGLLFLTTPNGNRFRNIAYMIAGKEILDKYRYPDPGEALGHQHEYTMQQMLWQSQRGGMEVAYASFYEDGFKGASLMARIARTLSAPVQMIPYLRNGIMIVLKPASPLINSTSVDGAAMEEVFDS
jgi:SAM-dependent methyltransferase